jgi:Uma2 family endonuclease
VLCPCRVHPGQARIPGVADSAAFVALRYAVNPVLEAWVLPEGTVPESVPHDEAAEALKLLLLPWADRAGRPLRVARNLAIRWIEQAPQVGIDPDVCVLDPPPANAENLDSLCLWRSGNVAPSLCFEVVSKNHPHKDYRDVHERYAALGARELIVFDPLLVGPPSLGGPVSLQVWRRDPSAAFERTYAGPGPVFSEVLEAWVRVDQRRLSISDDRTGERRWRTQEELERAEKDYERSEKERERTEKERERAEKERERAAREEVERKLALLEERLKDVETRQS